MIVSLFLLEDESFPPFVIVYMENERRRVRSILKDTMQTWGKVFVYYYFVKLVEFIFGGS